MVTQGGYTRSYFKTLGHVVPCSLCLTASSAISSQQDKYNAICFYALIAKSSLLIDYNECLQ